MTRHCNGEDENLIREIDPTELSVNDPRASKMTSMPYSGKVYVPCDCGKVFDDARCSTIYPHERLL